MLVRAICLMFVFTALASAAPLLLLPYFGDRVPWPVDPLTNPFSWTLSEAVVMDRIELALVSVEGTPESTIDLQLEGPGSSLWTWTATIPPFKPRGSGWFIVAEDFGAVPAGDYILTVLAVSDPNMALYLRLEPPTYQDERVTAWASGSGLRLTHDLPEPGTWWLAAIGLTCRRSSAAAVSIDRHADGRSCSAASQPDGMLACFKARQVYRSLADTGAQCRLSAVERGSCVGSPGAGRAIRRREA